MTLADGRAFPDQPIQTTAVQSLLQWSTCDMPGATVHLVKVFSLTSSLQCLQGVEQEWGTSGP